MESRNKGDLSSSKLCHFLFSFFLNDLKPSHGCVSIMLFIQNLIQSRPVKIANFGTLYTITAKARTVNLPMLPGKPKKEIPAMQRLRFKAYKAFMDELNKNDDE